MKLSYYTINDLRLGHDPRGRVGWRLSQFLDFQDALEHYRSLPGTSVKSFGLTNGEQVLELARCLPLSPNGHAGVDVLVLDFLALPFWRKEEGVIHSAKKTVDALNIRYCLTADRIVPAPTGQVRFSDLEDKYLWPDTSEDPASAVRWFYLTGTGWVASKELRRRFPTPERTYLYPVVSKYRADGVSEDGDYIPLELTYWEYKLLEHRAQERLNHKKIGDCESQVK